MDAETLDLSIIVPLYNEEESVAPLYSAIVDAVEPLDLEFEILFVDDGSRDQTFQRAESLARQDSRLRVVKFRRNYGQTPAMAAGIDNARGKLLITMDGDLQNDPRDIPKFISKMNEGYDIVVGWRHKRQDKLITRKIPSRIANWLIGKVTGVPIKDNGCSLKAYRADVIKNVPLYSEMHRFIPAMSSLTGARIAEIKVMHHARKFGVSKYGLSRIYKVALDLLVIKTIVSFAARSLLWFAVLAIPAGVIAAIGSLLLVRDTLDGQSSSVVWAGVTLTFGALMFFLLCVGVLSELVYKTGDMKLGWFTRWTTRVSTPSMSAQSLTERPVDGQ